MSDSNHDADSSVSPPSASGASALWPGAFSKADLRSGFLVFLIALPLCLGIAMASSFPPVAGILTAIVGGVLATFLGSAPLTIKGPAAGLIVIALGAVQELGGGDVVLGYKRALAVGVVAAVIQILLSFVRAATVGIAMSPSVVHGMLAAIGVIIISKQTHTVLGVTPEGKEPLHLLAEIPHSIANANPEILALGGVALAILFLWPLLKFKWAKLVPAPLIVLALTVPLALIFDLEHQHNYTLLAHSYHVGPEYLVTLPGSLIEAIAFPDFSAVFSGASIKYIAMFALVGSIESTLSVIAVDAMDPKAKPSNLNRDLFASGVGNLVSAMIGGLPMISEIVRSKANVDAGARSGWANFSHGMFLLAFVALAPGLLHMIPLAALGAMLVYTGARLASPAEFRHARDIGNDQLLLFGTTLVVTLATDLLIGVAAGIALKVILHLARGASFSSLFKTTCEETREGDELKLTMHGTAAFTNLLAVRKRLATLDSEIHRVILDLSDVKLVDHTFLSRVETMADEWPDASLQIVGVDGFKASSEHPHAVRRKA
ncbi:Bicarbonate transporter BicA [Planctomycetes bacterium Poly30]|uniref:Bicarbonate transporter BicA n=1 Tax=Saltatorellus ferox TaxID=2528018 RepID=A0A518EZN3_9BACT|nr:Bicarbonate transporter BicA [Planctomycetes bacterium Poly30]